MRKSVGVMLAAVMVAGYSLAADLVVKEGDTLAFMGDSITQFGGQNPGGYVNLVLKGLEVNGINVKPVKAGISGHKSNDMLARLDHDVLSKKANVMTLSCGVNDVWHGARGVPLDQYKTNITAILDKCQAANVKVVILTSTLINEPTSENNKKLDAYNDFLKALAKERNLPLADLNADMKAIIAKTGARNYLTVDGVHMATRGNVMMAKGVLAALGLTTDQIAKAQEAWMDMPGTCELKVNITIRQYEKVVEKAEAANGQPVSGYVNDQFGKFLETVVK